MSQGMRCSVGYQVEKILVSVGQAVMNITSNSRKRGVLVVGSLNALVSLLEGIVNTRPVTAVTHLTPEVEGGILGIARQHTPGKEHLVIGILINA